MNKTGRPPASGFKGSSPRLLLVNPSIQKLGWIRRFQLPPLSLLHVAAVTPEFWQVKLVDETIEPVPSGDDYDLVAITMMTYQSAHAYELADAFRSGGVPVVLGGIHPTVLPSEAQAHADAVVVGEVEPLWSGLLGDLLSGKLRPRYTAPEPTGNILSVPQARRELLAGKKYLTTQTLQSTRGCPYNCPFCTVTPYFGHRFRHRSIEEVIDEVGAFPKDFVLFLDDNVLADLPRARQFLERMVPLGKRWAGQATLNFAEDPKLLELLARSGCIAIFVGVEAISGESSHLAKRRNKTPAADLVHRIQDAGILTEVSMIFGFDDQDESIFDETVNFVESCAPCAATLHILTPYPGTEYFRRFEAEGRLLHKDWKHYNHTEVVFKPKLMSPERLYHGWAEARREIYSWRSILSRVARNRKHRLTNLAYNVFRRAPNRKLDPHPPVFDDKPGLN